MGARSTTDRDKMASAIAAFRNRNAVDGPAAEAALDAVAPQTRTLSASAGSLTQAARQLGFRDAGGLLTAFATNEMAAGSATASGTSPTQQASQSKTLSPQAVAKLPGLQGLESVLQEQLGSAIAHRGELLNAVMDDPSDLAQRTALGANIARMSNAHGSDTTAQAVRRAGEAMRTLNAATGGSNQTMSALRQQGWSGDTQTDLVTALAASELDPSTGDAIPYPISREQVSRAVPNFRNMETSNGNAQNTTLASSIVSSGRSNAMSQQSDLLAQAQIAPIEQPAFRQSVAQLSEAFGERPTLTATQNAMRAVRGLDGIAGNSGKTLQRLRQQGYAGATRGELIGSMSAQQLDPSQTQTEVLGIAPLTQEMVSRAFPELPAARTQSASPTPSIASNLNNQIGLFAQSGVSQNEWPVLASRIGNLRSEVGLAPANDAFRVAGTAASGLLQGAGSERELIQSLQQQGWVGSSMADLVSGMAHDHAGAVTGAAHGPTREQIQAIPGFSQIAGSKDANLVSAIADRARVFGASPSTASSVGDQGNTNYINEIPAVIGSLGQVIGENRANRAVIAAQHKTSMMEGVHGGTTEMLDALSSHGGSYANRSQLVGALADGYATTVTTGKDATGQFGAMPSPEAITAGSPLFAGLPTDSSSPYRPIFNRAAALQGVASQPEEWRSIGNAVEQLSTAYSPEQVQQGLLATGPAFAAMTQVAGGHASVVSRLRQAGWEGNDAGAVFTAMNASELTRNGIVPATENANLSQSSLAVGNANVLRQAFPELGDALRVGESGTSDVDLAAFSRQIMDAGGPIAFAQARQLQPTPLRR
ncbi:MAG: hypothetical protein HC853_15745 [Anaerolineae bacterium]|nr:hypothetical protein [Anaerolineae bacterium]